MSSTMSVIRYDTYPDEAIVDICLYKHIHPYEVDVKQICTYAIDEEKTQLEIIEMLSFMYGLYEDILANSSTDKDVKKMCHDMMKEYDDAIGLIETPRFNTYLYQLADEPLPIELASVWNGRRENICLSPIVHCETKSSEPEDNIYEEQSVDIDSNNYITPPQSPRSDMSEPPALTIRPGYLLDDNGEDNDTNESVFAYEYEIDYLCPVEFDWIGATPLTERADSPDTVIVHDTVTEFDEHH